jgi:hypothetical protein
VAGKVRLSGRSLCRVSRAQSSISAMIGALFAVGLLSGAVITIAHAVIVADLRTSAPAFYASLGSPHWTYFLMGIWISFGPYVQALFRPSQVFDRLSRRGGRVSVVAIWFLFPVMVAAWLGLICTVVL